MSRIRLASSETVCNSFIILPSIFPGRIHLLGNIDLRHLGEVEKKQGASHSFFCGCHMIYDPHSNTIISCPKERQPIPPKARAFVWLLISVAEWTHVSKLVAQP